MYQHRRCEVFVSLSGAVAMGLRSCTLACTVPDALRPVAGADAPMQPDLPADVARWRSLGVAEERITVTGNSKFDHADGVATRVDEFRAVLQRCGVATDSPVLLAGSTFPGEERIVAEVFRELRAEFPGLFLILVPRHVERTEDVLSDLRPLSLRIALRDSPEDRPVDALIVNTTGELRDWYHLADVVFIGKSLTSTGGQNPVEAVLADKPVVFGPHMENFEPLVGQWLAADAAIRVGDAPQLRAQLGALLRDPARRAALAARARSIAAVHIGASDRTVWCLLAQNGPARDRC